MRVDSYACSRPQSGHSANEDSFYIDRKIPLAIVADGAGNAERAAKRIVTLFTKLFSEANAYAITQPETWGRWIRILDSCLCGSAQSTFLAISIIDQTVIGVCVGDSRAYMVNRDGECSILTESAKKTRLGSGCAEAFWINRSLTHGDTLLLLSDGAWTPLGAYQLKKTVAYSAGHHFSELPSAILDQAGRAGRADDMTAIALRPVHGGV